MSNHAAFITYNKAVPGIFRAFRVFRGQAVTIFLMHNNAKAGQKTIAICETTIFWTAGKNRRILTAIQE